MKAGVQLKFNKRKLFSFLKIAFPIALLLLILFESKNMVKGFDINLLKNNISELTPIKILLILILGLVSIVPMLFYDLILSKILKIKLSYKKLLSYSWIVNTFSNFLGFGGVIGLSLRTYFYKDYYKEKDVILKSIAKVSIFYLSGLSILCWLVTLGIFKPTFLVEMKWLKIAVWGLALYIPFLLLSFKLRNLKNENFSLRKNYLIELMIISVFEWMFAFLLFMIIAHLVDVHISFGHLFPIFFVAACAGIISMIPGGLGSFDLVLLMGFEYYHIPSEKVLLILLLYRVSYYFIPFLIAIGLFAKHYWNILDKQYKQILNTIVKNISHWILVILVFLSGIVLLLSASLPGVLDRIRFLREFLSSPFMGFSHQLTVIAGFLLILLSRGIEYKVRWAYYSTLVVLIFGSLLCLVKGLDYEEAIYLSFVAIMLIISKKRFYRINFVITWGRATFDFCVIIFFTILYILIGYWNLPESKIRIPHFIQKYMIIDAGDLILSAITGLVIAAIIMFCTYLIIKPKSPGFYPVESEKIIEHVKKYKGTVLTHLIFLHDKKIFWNETGQVMMMYERYGDKLVVLGDPVGNEQEFFHAIEEFQDFADLYGFTPAYYQVTTDLIPKLHENGYDFFKLGEEAYVDLTSFTLSGGKMKGLRSTKNKFEKEGFSFQVLQPPFTNDLFQSLREISDQWLEGKSEKGYSLGFFDEDYLRRAPIAILNDQENKPMAFVSIMPAYDNHQTLSIDLMRHLPNTPSGTMDYLFLELFDWAKTNGYVRFNLGMAPLANVGLSKYSFIGEKVAFQIYTHGNFVYHFKGLRKFKEKYANKWEPKYLAYRKKTSLPITMIQIALLISRKRPS
ncbi:bifunctional lysylphosphatidylglycerol flippase/synthetase MprF [Heyndrickxia sp. NPDC080065]|uniref:bifunctional lysylphosphatidylglycerol flippase/synthetase MprF n=1 Tax=Heyndrickxia sp. NPDC080065 TaxID=3390568 RepID=UPI003D04166A